ncbi:MAG: hypothetical protein AAF456_04925 [Planctomycetota bacterium]
MKDLWKTIRQGVYIFALPLVATAAASAHQWINDNQPVDTVEIAAVAQADVAEVETLRSHTLSMDEDGMVRGRIVNIDSEVLSADGVGGLKVYFAQNGSVVEQAFTEADGSFAIEGLQAGVYSFVAAGELGFAAYGVNVVETGEFPNVMEAAAVSPEFAVVRDILEKTLGTEVAANVVSVVSEGDVNHVAGSNRVKLVDGDLVGNVLPIVGTPESVAGTVVHLIQNDEQVARVEVDNTGSFRVQDIEPGVYDFVAAGPQGFAAIGFEAVQEVAVDATDAVEETVVPVALAVPMTAPQDSFIVGDSVGYAYDTYAGVPYSDGYTSSPISYAGECGSFGAACGACGDAAFAGNCCGGFGGFGGCGGCGIGGIGGGGRFLRFAAIAAAIAIPLSSDDDDGDGGGMTPSNTN